MMDSRSRTLDPELPGFDSQPHYLQAVLPWVSYFNLSVPPFLPLCKIVPAS